jgi:hypothetical protein
MTAGTSATFVETDASTHPSNPSLPMKPRALSRSERNRREIFVFHSPKNNRVVTIAEMVHLALALQFEFDPSLLCYVERPRRIALSPRQEIDISFWTRSKTGEERYYLAIPNSGTMGSTSGNVSIRDQEELDEAAARHDLKLTYVTERQMISALSQCRVAFELLPHVWAHSRLIVRSTIRAQINAHLANNPRTTLADLIKLLDFLPDSIRAVAAAMVHDGSLRLVDYVAGNATATLEVVRA